MTPMGPIVTVAEPCPYAISTVILDTPYDSHIIPRNLGGWLRLRKSSPPHFPYFLRQASNLISATSHHKKNENDELRG